MGITSFFSGGWTGSKIRSFLSSEESDRMHMTGMLQKVINAGNVKVSAIAYKGVWGEVDNVEDLYSYQNT